MCVPEAGELRRRAKWSAKWQCNRLGAAIWPPPVSHWPLLPPRPPPRPPPPPPPDEFTLGRCEPHRSLYPLPHPSASDSAADVAQQRRIRGAAELATGVSDAGVGARYRAHPVAHTGPVSPDACTISLSGDMVAVLMPIQYRHKQTAYHTIVEHALEILSGTLLNSRSRENQSRMCRHIKQNGRVEQNDRLHTCAFRGTPLEMT